MSQQTPSDPAGTTHQFENFVAKAQQQPEKKVSGGNVGLVVGVAAVAVVAVVLVVALVTMV
ncbi:hypothetical protein DZF91_00600 [Actinomadura logoneensis]|uniref:Uncharacterized protein n=1 Tax=Actinomadura logoneensis TaxID=2293572 RepID=A0A372JU23_9ACTN|nr:hypothetical protein [Actinomadura logoneensis]RFU43532.1 hypothetical protein DZF91_00600 [Actinomadura logoneensis]